MNVQYSSGLILAAFLEIGVDCGYYFCHRTQFVEKNLRVRLGLLVLALVLNLVICPGFIPAVDPVFGVNPANNFCLVWSFAEKLVTVLGDVVDDILVWKGLFALL
jgi:hypothetical protein